MAEREAALSRSNDRPRSESLRREIAGTRAAMDQTLDSIGTRLRPTALIETAAVSLLRHTAPRRPQDQKESNPMRQGMMENTKQHLSDGADEMVDVAAAAGRGAVGLVKRHPVLTLAVGAGVAYWLIRSEEGRDDDRERLRHATSEAGQRAAQAARSTSRGVQAAGESLSHQAERVTDAATHASSRARSGASGVADRAADAAEAVAAAARRAADDARAKAGRLRGSGEDLVASARDRFDRDDRDEGSRLKRAGSRVAGEVGDKAGSAAHGVSRLVEEAPLATAAAALGGGVLLGLILPRTRRENGAMGRHADRLKSRAVDTGVDLTDRTVDAAYEAAYAAAEKAEREGWTPRGVAGKARRVAESAASAAKHSAETEGLTPDELREEGCEIAGDSMQAARDEFERERR